MGADRPRGPAPLRLQPLSGGGAGPRPTVPSERQDRLYGRQSGHKLRPRQRRLLDETLPRLRFAEALAAAPALAFAAPVARLRLEIGFGGGEHTLAIADAHPEDGLIASEVFANGICSLLTRLVPDGGEADAPVPALLRIWDRDARTLLRALPEGCLETVFLMFPDPWPKTRHARRRFVHPDRIPLVARVLRPGGTWRIASDDPTYQAWVHDIMRSQSAFAQATPSRQRPDGWPPTRYEAKAMRAGRTPLWWDFVRRDRDTECFT